MSEATVVEGAFTQEQVNTLVGDARTKGRESGLKEALKALGFAAIEDATTFVQTARDSEKSKLSEAEQLKAVLTETKTKLDQLTAERDEATLQHKTLSLEQTAVEIGAKQNVSPAKARQILKLIGAQPESFDPATGVASLDEQYKAFLAEPENKHFLGEGVVAPAGSGRKPNDGSGTAPKAKDKFEELTDRLTRF